MRLSILNAGALALAVSLSAISSPAQAREPYIGEIMTFSGNFCPRGWAMTNGQLLPISQNSALFSIMGTIYGGDGRTTFALPDLRGRVAVGPGTGPGLSNYRIGQRGGTETNRTYPSNAAPATGDESEASSRVPGDEENNMQPHLAVTHCVALVGIYPSRN